MIDDDLYGQAVKFYCQLAVDQPGVWFREAWHDHYTWKGRAILAPLNLWGQSTMARGKANAKPTSGTKAQWNTTFVDISLAGYEWNDVAEAWAGADNVFEGATTLLENGYRLGFSYNPQNDAFICSVTCKDETSPNSGKTFTAFAGTWFEALQTALFKHYQIAAETWGGNNGAGTRKAFG